VHKTTLQQFIIRNDPHPLSMMAVHDVHYYLSTILSDVPAPRIKAWEGVETHVVGGIFYEVAGTY